MNEDRDLKYEARLWPRLRLKVRQDVLNAKEMEKWA